MRRRRGYDVPVCSNYRPVSQRDRLLTFFGVERARDEVPTDIFPTGLAPFIRLAAPGSGNKRIVDDGHFGLLPFFAKELAYGRRTYNARSETVDKLPSFRDAWRRGQRCIIPAEAIFEPCYESGAAVRWRVQQDGAVPMGIAGLYTTWTHPEGGALFSFAMLTVNADGHPVFQRLHKPGEEKRMVVILAPGHHDDWLTCTNDEAKRYFAQWRGPLLAEPDPLPRRVGAAGASGRRAKGPSPDVPGTGDLF